MRRAHKITLGWLLLSGFVVVTVLGLSGCGQQRELTFSSVPVTLTGFKSDLPTTTSAVRVGKRIEETALIPSGKLSELESVVARMRKEGWRQMSSDIRVNEVYYMFEKDGVRVELTHRPNSGITIVASRSATEGSAP
ncbi:MAG: hypothetical protein N2644_02690 [Candidatus Sumerlaea chitinivorans]|nr:hypothetical protein [Candidatus Sumerlaea chitinivorans]